MQIDVTTVSRGAERRIDAPAAVSVITAEDIRRYGVDTLADALRLADSVSVARFNGGSWAIATRGFSAITNNKMLVMIDGRSVYTQLFGGVFWEAQHVPLPDLDRIEIIRGPAGTLWGPNAVNGVINIITKRAADTQGALVRGVTGSRERAHIVARYGGQINPKTSYRFYGVGSDFDSPELADGSSAQEDRRLRQGGGRLDWELAGEARLTVQGDVISGRMGLADRPDIKMDGGNVVVTYTKPIAPGNSFQLLGYADREHRDVPRQSWETRATYNIEGQHSIRLAPRYQLLWGGGVRTTQSDTQPTELIVFDPEDRTINQVHGFAQAEITLRPDVSVTLGTRGERTTFSGFRVAAGRAREVHAESRRDHLGRDFARCPDPDAIRSGPARAESTASSSFAATASSSPRQLTAYESGVRVNPRSNVSMEASVFHNEYDDLRSQEATPLITLANLYDGHTTGVELAGNVQLHRALARARQLHRAARVAETASRKPGHDQRARRGGRSGAHVFHAVVPQPAGRSAA